MKNGERRSGNLNQMQDCGKGARVIPFNAWTKRLIFYSECCKGGKDEMCDELYER